MRYSADPIDLTNYFATKILDYLVIRFMSDFVIPAIRPKIKTLHTKIKELPILRIEFGSTMKTTFFIRLPTNNLTQFKRTRTQELDFHGNIYQTSDSTDEKGMESVAFQAIVSSKYNGQEYLIKHVLQSYYGATIGNIIREKKSLLPRIELVQF